MIVDRIFKLFIHSYLTTMNYFILKENILLWFIQPSILPKTNITQQVFLFGPFSCEAHDSQKDIFEGNHPKI